MAELGEVHLHLPAGFRGVIHLHVGADAGADAGPAAVRPVREDPEAAVGDEPPDAAIEEMLQRFEGYDAHTAARRVYAEMIRSGWDPFLPRPRGGRTKSDAAYIRLVCRGSTHRVTLYLNSAALMSSGTRERDFVRQLPGADPQNEDVYLHYSEGRETAALAAAEDLRLWADGADGRGDAEVGVAA